ncbi:MAG TPA: hypothetical protein VFG22_13610 [Polyangiales bacterium]|nr:hypothetical protein [Polyangiales bacterium]
MEKKTKNLVDRVRDVMDTLVEALEGLLNPPPALVPVRVRPQYPAIKRRR